MKLIKLTRGKYAKVDNDEFIKLNKFNWQAVKIDGIFYAKRSVFIDKKNQSILMHRHLLGLKKNDGIIVDHKDRDGLNNKRNNLRIATHSQNGANKKARGTSKYIGVHLKMVKYKSKTYLYWTASIQLNYKSTHLGNFKTEKEAATAYNKKAKELHGEFANFNKL